MGIRTIPRRSFRNIRPAKDVAPPPPVAKPASPEKVIDDAELRKQRQERRERFKKEIEERRKQRRQKENKKDVPAPTPEPVIEDKYEGKTREQWWTDRFPKRPILYKAQDGNLRDVRNFIFEHSHILDQVIAQANLKGVNDDQTVYNCCMFVQQNIRYVGDQEARGQVEFWQNPEDTITRGTGDCEDGAILMKSLTQCAGVPDWKVKIVAGDVKGGGHAYCTYIRDDDTQCILDWCYWPNQLPVNQRKPFAEEENYYDIWFSFNNANSFAEARVTYTKGQVEKHITAKKPVSKKSKSIVVRSKPRTRPVKL